MDDNGHAVGAAGLPVFPEAGGEEVAIVDRGRDGHVGPIGEPDGPVDESVVILTKAVRHGIARIVVNFDNGIAGDVTVIDICPASIIGKVNSPTPVAESDIVAAGGEPIAYRGLAGRIE